MSILAVPDTPPLAVASAPGKSTVKISPPLTAVVPLDGTGELSSQFPDALTTVDGVPISAQVLVRYRAPTPGAYGDGTLVAAATSTPAGEWRITGLNRQHHYDVFARVEGENDALQTAVTPVDAFAYPRLIPAVMEIPIGLPADIPLPIVGGDGDVISTLAAGSLPSGLALTANRLVGAWPTGAPGRYELEIDLTDDNGTYRVPFNVDLVLLPLTLMPEYLPAMVVNTPVSEMYKAAGGEGPYTYSVTAGTLPVGLSLNSSTGALTGTPTVPGAFSFTVTATDTRSATAHKPSEGWVAAEPFEYWRLWITKLDDYPSRAGIAELEMYESPGGPNRAVGGTPIEQAFSNPEDGFDGDINTRWIAATPGTLPNHLGYQMATPAAINIVAIRAATPYTTANAPCDFVIQSSNDGVTWNTEWSVTGEAGWTAGERRVFTRT